MTSRRGFTLMDLSAELMCAILLVLVFLPSCRTPKPGRAGCAMNLSNMGKALAIYAASYNDQMPYLLGNAWDVTATGTNRGVEPDNINARATTALMFMLMRDGSQSAKMFVCPNDKDVTEDLNVQGPINGQGPIDFYWDFSSAANCSYAFQLPLSDNSNGIPPTDTPFNATAEQRELAKRGGNVVIMADKPPATNLGAYAANSKTASFMSPNHGGDYINYLRANMSVQKTNTPNCGEGGDYIYTASGSKDGGSQYGGSPTLAAHLSPLDSCLIGPK